MGNGTGFFRVVEARGNWTLLDPDGHPFQARGINHYCNGAHMPWNLKQRYGSVDVWRRSIRERHRDWGFTFMPTSVGPAVASPEKGGPTSEGNVEWTADEFMQVDYPFTAMLAVPLRYMAAGRDYPDVFSADFRRLVDERCRELVKPLADNPNLVGWHFCHNPPWHDRAPGFDRWLEVCAASPDGLNAWIDLMRETYGNTDNYRDTYGPALDSFKDIRQLSVPVEAYISIDKSLRDRLAYMHRVCEEWYKVFSGTIRQYDTNHLLLGDRNTTHMFHMADWSLRVMADYIDVLSINIMGAARHIREIMGTATPAWSGPILLADTGVSIQREGSPRHGYMCRDIDEFATVYRGLLELCASHPQIIGFAWCGYYDMPMYRHGIVDVATDEPLSDMVDVMAAANAGGWGE